MAAGPQPTLESLTEYVTHLVQINEQVQTQLANAEAQIVNAEDEKQQIVAKVQQLEAMINKLTANTIELERKLSIGTSNDTERELKRIQGINLLKGKEFEKFSKKDSYELWIDGIKNDLYSQLPDARAFVEFAENPYHFTAPSSTTKHTLPPTTLKRQSTTTPSNHSNVIPK